MGNGQDLITVIFLVLAVVIFFRLRSVLGERTGHEKPPYRPEESALDKDEDNVVPMPGRKAPPRPAPQTEELDLTPFAKPDTPLFSALEDLVQKEPNFSPALFLDNAKQAYEMIVLAFAKGDKKLLSELLAKDVYEGFAAAIDQRAENDEVLHTDFIGFDSAKFIDVDYDGKEAMVTVRFESNLISLTKDSSGKIIEGDPSEVVNVIDYWTFGREIGSSDPVWYLVSTEYEKD